MTALTMSMWTTSVVVMMMLIQGGSTRGKFDWCEHDCNFYGEPQTKHSMCALPEGGGDNCRDYTRGLTLKEKPLIVHLHNQLRAKVANGQETRGVGGAQPMAADMMELVWDDELAMIAQRWADQCLQGGHDECRKTMDGARVGQNVGIMNGNRLNQAREDQITKFVKAWYDEVEDMVTSDVDSVFRSSRGKIGHYTQLVWGRTSRIGCGMSYYNSGTYSLKFVCNYKLAGNYDGAAIYTRGAPASNCPPNSQPSTEYRGLCRSNGKEDFSEPTITISPSGMMSGLPSSKMESSPPSTGPQDYRRSGIGSGMGIPPFSRQFGAPTLGVLKVPSTFPQNMFADFASSSPGSRVSVPASSSSMTRSTPVFSNPSSDTLDYIIEIRLSP